MYVLIKNISCFKIFLFVIFLFIIYQRLIHQKNEPSIRFNEIFVFGDSFSYTGNDTIKQNQTSDLITNRYQDRFCDDLIWIERLNITKKYSYALPGATTDNNFYPSIELSNGTYIPSAREQIINHVRDVWNTNFDMSQPLYIIWIGFNDYYLHQKSTRPQYVVNSILNVAVDLLIFGAMNLLIFNQPSLEIFPCYRYNNHAKSYNERTSIFNTQFRRSLAKLQKDYPNTSIHLFDLHTLLTEIISNRTSKIFTNTIDPCFESSLEKHCLNPREYVFVDNIHFTSTVHQLIADSIQPFLLNNFQKDASDSYIFSF